MIHYNNYIKRLLIFLIFFIFLLQSVSCRDANGLHKDKSASAEKTQPVEPTFVFSDFSGLFEDAEFEEDYSNVYVRLGKEKYNSSDKYIECTVADENIGKAFYVYTIVYPEKFDNGEWIPVDCKESAYRYAEDAWAVCYIEGNKTKPNSTELRFWFDDAVEPFGDGEYRLAIFVGDKKLYAQFLYES